MDTLTIVLPVYNEKETIELVLKEWQYELKKYSLYYNFMICEDGSTDGTGQFLRKIKSKYNLILNQKQKRRGYGAAVVDGIKTASSKYILCVDSDGQCDPSDLKKFWSNRNNDDVILGFRQKRADPASRKLFSFLFKVFFTFLFPSNIKDPSCPFVLFKKKTIISLVHYLTFLKEGFWWGFVATSINKKLSIHEIPINHRPRLKGNTQIYAFDRIIKIAYRNARGLIQLKESLEQSTY